METCPKPAVPRPAIDGRQPRRLAIEANELPIRGAYFSYRSLFQLKFELLRLFTIPSVSHRDLVCLVSLVRTFLQAPLQARVPRDAKAVAFSTCRALTQSHRGMIRGKYGLFLTYSERRDLVDPAIYATAQEG